MSRARTRPDARAFSDRYRHERERHGLALPNLILDAYRGRGGGPLRRWLAPFTPSVLSAALEAVLESDERQKQLGVYSTGADVAAFMARVTILPFLLAGHILPIDDLAGHIADNRDLMTLFHT